LVLDDELNVLPLSKGKDVSINQGQEEDRGRRQRIEELKDMKANLEGADIVGALAKLAKTVDQVS
jgi:N-acetyltransferase 10